MKIVWINYIAHKSKVCVIKKKLAQNFALIAIYTLFHHIFIRFICIKSQSDLPFFFSYKMALNLRKWRQKIAKVNMLI